MLSETWKWGDSVAGVCGMYAGNNGHRLRTWPMRGNLVEKRFNSRLLAFVLNDAT